MTDKKQQAKRKRLIREFCAARDNKKEREMSDYITALHTGKARGLTGKEYASFVERIFALFLSDLGFNNITDAVYSKDATASLTVFKKEMKRLLRECGVDKSHYLLKQ